MPLISGSTTEVLESPLEQQLEHEIEPAAKSNSGPSTKKQGESQGKGKLQIGMEYLPRIGKSTRDRAGVLCELQALS